ncbi:serine acetyltransferase [Psychroserpens mesophilus]|uniref:serine acetyltransferase n=1 Tax=Psychroserpens mesophilus TaxID=325473 RepID=UPI003D65099B
MTQIQFFVKDVKRMLGKRKIRILHVWLKRSFWGILLYRLERSFFLVFGKAYGIIRVPFIPIFNILQSYSNIEIHYKANIKGGLSVLHPSVGCVISWRTNIGENLTLTGGNIIGIKTEHSKDKFIIGNNCTFGANATVVGPLQLGNDIIIGASACVTESCLTDGSILMGVPAKVYNKTNRV